MNEKDYNKFYKELREIEIELNKIPEGLSLAEKDLDKMDTHWDNFKILLFGIMFGISINLITDIVHPFLLKFGKYYYEGVVWFFLITLILTSKFIIDKWEKIKNSNVLIKKMVLKDPDPSGIIELNKKFKKIVKKIESYSNINKND